MTVEAYIYSMQEKDPDATVGSESPNEHINAAFSEPSFCTYKIIWAMQPENGSLDMSNESFSMHAWPLCEATCLIWLKFLLGLLLT